MCVSNFHNTVHHTELFPWMDCIPILIIVGMLKTQAVAIPWIILKLSGLTLCHYLQCYILFEKRGGSWFAAAAAAWELSL